MNLFPNELDPISYRAMAEAVVKWIQSHPQLCSSNQNRLLQQCKLYIESEGIIQKTHPDWLAFMQGLKDIQEYWFIIEILGEQLLEAPFIEQFKLSLQDPSLPRDSKDATPGRNAQFELFLAAIASRAGFTVERLGAGKADWVLTASGHSWSLEAKRIKSLDKMEKHIRKAGKQILTSRIGGIIAVDISLAINPNCAPLSAFVPDTEIEKAHSNWGFRLEPEVNDKEIERTGRQKDAAAVKPLSCKRWLICRNEDASKKIFVATEILVFDFELFSAKICLLRVQTEISWSHNTIHGNVYNGISQ